MRRANGEALDSFFEMHLKYRLVSARHLWTVEFEAPKDWATGNYRFQVSGKALGSPADYAMVSNAFAVTAASNLQIAAVQCADGRCSTALKYTPQPKNYRVIDSRVPSDQAAPVRRGSVTFSNGIDSVTDKDVDGDGRYQATISGTATAVGSDVVWKHHAQPRAAEQQHRAGSIAGCLLQQDPALCQSALESLSGLTDCSPDESGFNCAYNVAYNAVGVATAANAISGLDCDVQRHAGSAGLRCDPQQRRGTGSSGGARASHCLAAICC